MENILNDSSEISYSYNENVGELLKNVENAQTLATIDDLFIAFSNKFTMIPSLWIKWFELQSSPTYIDFDQNNLENRRNFIKKEAKKHFLFINFSDYDYQDEIINANMLFNPKIIAYMSWLSLRNPVNTKILQNALNFPHPSMNDTEIFLQKYGTSAISPSAVNGEYTDSKKFFRILFTFNYYKRKIPNNFWETIFLFLQDVFELVMKKYGITLFNKCRHPTPKLKPDWYKRIVNYPDKNFIKNSFEKILKIRPYDKKMWMFYIEFLKEESQKCFAFSRYCRLFFNDGWMRKEYIKIVEGLQNDFLNCSKWWIDIIEIERCFGSVSKSEELLKKCIKTMKFEDEIFLKYVEWFHQNLDNENTFAHLNFEFRNSETNLTDTTTTIILNSKQQNSPLYFSSTNTFQQFFSLPYNFVNYLSTTTLTNLNATQKLYQSCKYFYQKSAKKPLCFRLGIFNDCISTYFEQSLFLNLQTYNSFEGLNGITVTNMLQIVLPQLPTATSKILLKLDKCEILYLHLVGQNISKNELKNLTQNKSFKDILFERVTVADTENDNEVILPIEKIIEIIPQAINFEFRTCLPSSYTPETGRYLAQLNRPQSIAFFKLTKVPQNFSYEFFIFIKKFVLPTAQIYLQFNEHVDDSHKHRFYKIGEFMLDSYKHFTVV